MESLRGAVRPYAWGSRTMIAELLGNPVPAPHPEAELWFGAHPADPSTVGGVPLTELLAADPHAQLGADTAARWEGRLPFLLKVLAAEEPLSLQAHPSPQQARDGFEREEAAGISRQAPERNYPDPTAKPELLCALTEFHALSGFRDPHRTVELLRTLDADGLAPYTELLAGQPDADGLRALFTTLVTLPATALEPLLPAVVDACVRHVRERGAFDAECRTVLELAERYPGDPGVLAALLLNRIVLAPGEAIHLPAGNLHAYLHGAALEILANSDNVLRCGLTPKHVDVPELLRVLDFSSGDLPVLKGEQVAEHLRVYCTVDEEFELSAVEFDAATLDTECAPEPVMLDSPGPQVLLCVSGAAEVATAGAPEPKTLRRGEALWLPAGDGALAVRRCEPDTDARDGDTRDTGEPTRIYRAAVPCDDEHRSWRQRRPARHEGECPDVV